MVGITRADFWNEVEIIGKQWQESMRTGYPLIPLLDLQPLWNSAVKVGTHPMDRLRLESLGHENLLLKAENARLKRQLEQVTSTTDIPQLERRRTERRVSSGRR